MSVLLSLARRNKLLPAWRREVDLLLRSPVASYHEDNRRRLTRGPPHTSRVHSKFEGRQGPPQRSGGAGGVSSELRKLSLEDDHDAGDRKVRHAPAPGATVEDSEVVFGVGPCFLALTQGRRTPRILYVKDGQTSQRASVVSVCEEAHQRGVQVRRVGKKDLDRMSCGGVHQGVCLQASPLSYLTQDSGAPRGHPKLPLWLVLDRIQDPMNLGAILRSAYFLGVDRVASSLLHSCPLTPVVSKASSGSMEVLEVYGYRHLGEMVRSKAAQGWQVVGTVGTDLKGAQIPVTQCSDFHMSKPTLLLMGGEKGGLSEELLSLCQALLTVPAGRPLTPGIESLNVSVATGVLLHSLLASRRSHR